MSGALLIEWAWRSDLGQRQVSKREGDVVDMEGPVFGLEGSPWRELVQSNALRPLANPARMLRRGSPS